MRKTRRTKLIVIIVLVVAVCGMSIGFAAFSVTLTISSRATVSPASGNLALKMYGFTGQTFESVFNLDNYTSETIANMLEIQDPEVVLYNRTSIIDSDSLSLYLGEVELKNPNNFVYTFIKIVNEGNYDAYFDSSQFTNNDFMGTCVAGEGTSETLVEEVCPYIVRGVVIYTEESFEKEKQYYYESINYDEYNSFLEQDCFYTATNYGENKVCKLAKGEQLVMLAIVGYNQSTHMDGTDVTPRADGLFSVTFPDLKLEFTSNDPSGIE